jgi:cobalamin biosynthesis Mg chelatase CobN
LNEIRKGYLRVKRNPVSINMPIRNVKISSSKDTIIAFNKVYIKRSADATHTTTVCTTTAHDATTEASAHRKRRKKRSAVVETETSASVDSCSAVCSSSVTESASHDTTTASGHRKRRRKRSAVVETETSASDHTASSSCEDTDNSFRNYSIAMSIVLVFLFFLIFFLYYLCYKDLIIETITKVKFFKYY